MKFYIQLVEDPWDDNDYTFLKSVAFDIDMGGFDLETLRKWKGAGTSGDSDGTNLHTVVDLSYQYWQLT